MKMFEGLDEMTFQDFFLFICSCFHFFIISFYFYFFSLSNFPRFFLGGYKEGAFVNTWKHFVGRSDVIEMISP